MKKSTDSPQTPAAGAAAGRHDFLESTRLDVKRVAANWSGHSHEPAEPPEGAAG